MNMAWNEVGVQFSMWYRVQVKALSLRSAKIDSIPSLGDKFEIRSGRKLFFSMFSMFLNVTASVPKLSFQVPKHCFGIHVWRRSMW